MRNVREKLGQPYEFPDGFKQSIKPNSGSARKYSGTPKFKDLENWLVTVTNCFTLSRLGGPDTAVDKLRVDFLQSWLEGEALKWYNRHVVSATQAITLWTFCDMIEGLYDCFVHASSMQDAREGFQRVRYSATTGVQSFYDALLDHAHNMSIYPDNYSILEQFLTGLPMPMVNRILEEGYFPEIHTVEEFVLKAKSIENYEKTKAYFEAMKCNVRNNNPAAANKPTSKNVYACHKMGHNGQRPAEEVPKGTPPAPRAVNNRPRFANRNNATKPRFQKSGNPPKDANAPKKQASPDDVCFKCGQKGHFAHQCHYPPKERKEFLQAARSTIHGEESSNAQVSDVDDEKENEDAESVTSHASQPYTEIEVAASEFYKDYDNDSYGEEYDRDCTSAMNVVPLECSATILDEDVKKCDIIAASIVEFRKGNPAEKDNWKYWFKASEKTRSRPQVPPEDKECLATYIKVGDLDTWTLWDSGSTTLGITPHYAEVANVVVDTLSDPHILQLGTVGSRSIINFGADTTLTIGG